MDKRYRQMALSREKSKIRVLAIERMLSDGKRMTASQIQDRLERQYDIYADRKTIYKDLMAIDRFMPLELIPGRGGGYRIMDVRW